jgi:hypothetical protein
MSNQGWLERVKASEPFEMPDWEFIDAVLACAVKVARFNTEVDFFKPRDAARDFRQRRRERGRPAGGFRSTSASTSR